MKARLLVLVALVAAGVFLAGSAVTHFGKPHLSEKSELELSKSESGRLMKARIQVTIRRCEWPAFWQPCRTYVAEANGWYIADPASQSVTGVLNLKETVSVSIKGQQAVILTCNTFSISGLPDVQTCKSFTGEEVNGMLLPMRIDFNTREILGPELRRLQRKQEEELRNNAPISGGVLLSKSPLRGSLRLRLR